MRFEVLQSLHRLGKAAGYGVSVLNIDVPMKWTLDNKCEYAFQIADYVNLDQIRRLFEGDAKNKFYLVMSLDEVEMDLEVRKFRAAHSFLNESIKFACVGLHRTDLDIFLSKLLFGVAVYRPQRFIIKDVPEALPDIENKIGIILARLSKEMNYLHRCPQENVYVWYRQDMVGKILEVIVGDGFKYKGVYQLSRSAAEHTIYITTKLYGDTYHAAVKKILRMIPGITRTEFMSVVNIHTVKELEDLLRKRIYEDHKVKTEVDNLKKDKDVWGW